MKLNLLLLTAFGGLASAIPLSDKIVPKSECKKSDDNCKLEQSKLCFKDVLECLNTNDKYMDCIELANSCNDIWRIDGNKPTPVPKQLKPEPSKPKENVFEPTKQNVKIIGRAKYMGDALWVGNTDSGIEFKINGKKATIVVATDSIYGSSDPNTYAHILVYGDGKLVVDTLTSEDIMDVDVEFEKVGEHVVRLLKVTECQDGSIFINEIRTDSKVIAPTPPKSKKIEFIGDSITCGVGALEKEGNSLSTSANGINSYAYVAAEKLDADFSIFSYGGYGIYSVFKGRPDHMEDYLIPNLYGKLGQLEWNFVHPEATEVAMNSVEWDASEFEPDLIVINLGTNDKFYINSVSEDLREAEQIKFSEAYKDFIAQIRSVHPNAEILCTLGMMGQFLYEEIENAVDAYVKETGDTKVNAFPLSEEDIEKNGAGFSGHPGVKSHLVAADELIEQIENLYGWTPKA